MSEPLKPCPHCQGTDLKISPRDWHAGNGVVLTCQNPNCIARIWGLDEADVIVRWNRRTPNPATKAMLEWAKENYESRNDKALKAFIDEWKNP